MCPMFCYWQKRLLLLFLYSVNIDMREGMEPGQSDSSRVITKE